MTTTPEPQPQPQPQKQPLRRIYTSQVQQIPGQLSYQNIKLANFLELELTDLWDSLQQLNCDNFKNQLKESLSRSYNVFHQMKRLFGELGMNFLYGLMKKLVSSYGLIFVHLMERLEKYEKAGDTSPAEEPLSQTLNAQLRKTLNPQSQISQQEVISTMQALRSSSSSPTKKLTKRGRGIHLFNESYSRCMDYDLEYFRQVRQKQSEKLKTEEEKLLIKAQEERRFRNQVYEELNDYSYLKVDGEELYVFLDKHRKMSEAMSKVSLEEELEKIAGFFKESQHQALQFLRKEKNVESFHSLTEGFNLIVTDYEQNKEYQIHLVKDKIKQLFEYVQKKLQILQIIIKQKDKEIHELKLLLANKKILTEDHQTQTLVNFDEEMKNLQRRITTAQMINEELKMHGAKQSEDSRRERSSLVQQLTIKEVECKKLKEVFEQKVNYINKMERKLSILSDSMKGKNIQDPLQFFSNLSDEMKRYICEELKEQGFIKPMVKNEPRHSSIRRQNSEKKQNVLTSTLSPAHDYIVNNEERHEGSGIQLRKRQSSFYRRATGSNFYKESSQNKSGENGRKSGHLSFAIPEQDQNYSSGQATENETSRQNSGYEKQPVFKSKKIISIKPIQNETQEKPRVFDIQQRGNFTYSQKFMEMQNLQKSEQKMKMQAENRDKDRQAGLLSKSKKNLENKSSANVQDEDTDGNQVERGGESRGSTASRLQASAGRKIKYQTSQVSENQLEQSVNDSQGSRSRSKLKKSSQSRRLNKSKVQINEQASQQNVQQQASKPKKVKARPSCQLLLTDQSNKPSTLTTENKIAQQPESQSGHQKKCSITNAFSLTISNVCSPVLTSSNNILEPRANGNGKGIKSEINNRILEKIGKMQGEGAGKNEELREINRIKEEMKATARKIKNNQESQYRSKKDSEIELENRKTQSNNMSTGKKSNYGGNNNGGFNTIHNEGISRLGKQNLSQTMTTFKRNDQGMLRQGRSMDKTKSLIRVASNHQAQPQPQTLLTKLLEQEFDCQQIIEASRTSATAEEFQAQVLKLHAEKCGTHCKHLQRYLEIFEKLKREGRGGKREIIRLHVQDMNMKLGGFDQGVMVGLPVIGRK